MLFVTEDAVCHGRGARREPGCFLSRKRAEAESREVSCISSAAGASVINAPGSGTKVTCDKIFIKTPLGTGQRG